MNLSDIQKGQPWTVPYSADFTCIAHGELPHLYGSHAVLHAVKSVGKLAAVFESFDHRDNVSPTDAELQTIADMSADLVTAALRLANIYRFDLEDALVLRVVAKNGVGFWRKTP